MHDPDWNSVQALSNRREDHNRGRTVGPPDSSKGGRISKRSLVSNKAHLAATMAPTLPEMDIFVIQIPRESQSRQTYASFFRKLRLQALREDPESFTEKHDEASIRPMAYWNTFIEQHNGLIHISFGFPKSEASKLAGTTSTERNDLVMKHGKPLGMAVNTGPVPQDLFLHPPGSQIPTNRPDDQEQRFHGGMFFLVPEMRGAQRGNLFEHMVLDRDQWLLGSLRSGKTDPPPFGRLRGNVKPGLRQKTLLTFYTREGWYIAGTQTWRSNLLAEGGLAAVEAAENRGDNMDEVSIVVEKIFTVAQLEWQIKKNKSILAKASARL
jgi:hypothetical protein